MILIINSDSNNHNSNNNLNNTDKNFINNINNEEFMVNFYNKMELLLIQNDNLKQQQIELIKKSDEILKQNEEFKEDIKYLKEENDKIKKQLIISNKKNKSNKTNTTNTNINIDEANINLNVQINNFNDMDYSKINLKNLIKTLIKEQGKQIFLKTIQDIFVNPEKPENHNIYIADKNIKYVKVYNDKKWITDDFKIIDKIIENLVNVYKLSIEEIKKDNQLYEKIKKSIQDKMKYLNYCNPEYLAELEYEQENDDIDNKDEIKRSKDFYEMVYNDIINLLHDNKNIILNTHKNNILTT